MKNQRAITQLLTKVKVKNAIFEYLFTEKDKLTGDIRLRMIDNEKIKEKMETDPFFKRLIESANKSARYSSKTEDEKKKYVDEYYLNLFAIIVASSSLSEAIDLLTLSCIKIINSQKLTKKFVDDKNLESSATTKLHYLRFANIISEDEYLDLYKIFTIRNEFAHHTIVDMQEIFEELKDFKGISNELKQVPNNADKYVKITLFYKTKLFDDVKAYANRNNWKPPTNLWD